MIKQSGHCFKVIKTKFNIALVMTKKEQEDF